MIVCSLSNVTPPVFTVTSDVSPSAIVAADTSTVKLVASFAEISTFLLPITVESWLASTVIVSASSTSVSSNAVIVAVPLVCPASIVISAGEIV